MGQNRSSGVDWDAALLAAIPRVDAAQDPEQYAAAVQGMLDALGDPATRVIPAPASAAAKDPNRPAGELPSFRWEARDTLLVSIVDPDGLLDADAAVQRLSAAAEQLAKAKG